MNISNARIRDYTLNVFLLKKSPKISHSHNVIKWDFMRDFPILWKNEREATKCGFSSDMTTFQCKRLSPNCGKYEAQNPSQNDRNYARAYMKSSYLMKIEETLLILLR